MRFFKILILSALILFANLYYTPSSFASEKSNLGAGIILGEPTGVSLEVFNLLVFGVAWSFSKDHFHLHCDYWIYDANLVWKLNWFIGVGLKFVYGEDKDGDGHAGLGLRIPVGLEYFIIERLELFVEFAPGISFIPDTSFDWGAGIGIRYYFPI